MIRKLVGTMVSVAKERISLNTLEHMMSCPHEYYNDEVDMPILSQQGLFLKQVHYDLKDFEYTENDYEEYLNQQNEEAILKHSEEENF